ncbi:hypothetical protein [Phytohabitans suffuscus]|uniref:Uncharacterized protein n=1 Tax=Phytohabitans suffuscus TaxID=624315 RepID=A0A6F8YYZ3_9ACTN|nr:hypothetical protein [Phytohabitans suffuscus]BCB91213.1 hypothetical protein Psuf_085260 [Phytohabitans suffuscus]
MRHLWTLIAAVVIAPLAWVLLAYGQDRSIQAFLNEEAAGAFSGGDFSRSALCLAAAGLLLGLLGTLRISPAGAVLTGLAYTGSYLALLADPDAVLNLIPGRVSLAGREADLQTPLRTGSAMVLGAALLLAVASAGRWRRTSAEPAEDVDVYQQPLGADGLDMPSPATTGEFDRTPVGASARWSGEGAHSLVPTHRQSRWQDLAHDSGTESRRWPTTGE